jgi:hypothetical protein
MTTTDTAEKTTLQRLHDLAEPGPTRLDGWQW